MLKHRVLSATLFLSLVLVLALWAPTWLAVFFIAGMGVLATHEGAGMMTAGGYPALRGTSVALGALILLEPWLVSLCPSPHGALLTVLLPAIAAWVVFLACLFRTEQRNILSRLTGTFLTLAYVPVLFQFFVLVLLEKGGEARDGRMLLVYGILVVKFTDMGAYFTGCAIGKHKLIPRISPAKTWEGVFGGVLVSTLVSLLILKLTGFQLSGISFSVLDGILLGLLLSTFGILGDLVESMLKRAAGLKDSGRSIPGMGGLLDVFDSLLFAIPMLYLYLQWIGLRG